MIDIAQGTAKSNSTASIADVGRAAKARRIDGGGGESGIEEDDSHSEEDEPLLSDDDGELSDEDDFSDEEEFSDTEELSDVEEGGEALCDESLRLIKCNDPSVTSLTVERFPNHINGYEAGDCIGDSTCLKKLTVKGGSMDWSNSSPSAWLSEFCKGISPNTSIEQLTLKEVVLSDVYIASPYVHSPIGKLSPFIKSHINLRSLEMVSCEIGPDSFRVLLSALSQRGNKNSLQRIILDAIGINDDAGKDLIEALEGYKNLEELSLGDNEIGMRSCEALQKLLSTTKLTKLNLENNCIDDYAISELTDVLDGNTTLKELNLSLNCDITQSGWRMFASCLMNNDSSIDKLDLASTNISDEGAAALGTALASNTTLKALSLYDINSNGTPLITGAGWQPFFRCLHNKESALAKIDLRYNSIEEEALPALANALTNNSNLKLLDLSHNTQVSAAGWRSFFSGMVKFALEKLHLADNNITNEVMSDLAHVLADNETLKTIGLCENVDLITNRGWSHFAHLLCDKSSISSTYASNHTLQCIDHQSVPNDLDILLQNNKYGSKKEVARRKILRYYFKDGEMNVPEFVNMKWKVMPHAISWIGRDNTGHNLLYQLLRSQPSLFVSQRSALLKSAGAKRKRGL